MLTFRESEIIEYFKNHGESSSKEVFDNISAEFSYATLKRVLTKLVSENYIKTKGKGKGTRYLISPVYELIQPVDIGYLGSKRASNIGAVVPVISV